MSPNRGMDTEDVTHIHNGILLSHLKEQNNAMPFIVILFWNLPLVLQTLKPDHVIFLFKSLQSAPQMDCHNEWSKSDRKTNIMWYCLCVESKKRGTCELIYKTEVESQTWKTNLGYRGKVGWICWEIGMTYTHYCM